MKTLLQPSLSIQRRLSWLPLVITLVYTLITAGLQATTCAPAFKGKIWGETWGWMFTVISAIGFGVLCVLILRAHHPNLRIGWLCGIIALTSPIISAPQTLLYCAEQGLIPLPGYQIAAWLSNISSFALFPQYILLPLLFPDGNFISTGWRRVGLAVCGLVLIGILLASAWPVELFSMIPLPEGPRKNPLGLPFQTTPDQTLLVFRSFSIGVIGAVLIANFSLFARWGRSSTLVRQQLKVFAYFLLTISSGYMLFQLAGQFLLPEIDLFNLWNGWLYMLLNTLLWAGYPLAVGVAVLKYRLYDIDVVIRKTLTYSLLTGLLASAYYGGVAILQGLLVTDRGQPSPAVIVVTTLAIAALFNPMRRRIQDFIDRRFYRRKYDAEKSLSAFAAAARNETDLNRLSHSLTGAVQETLQPEKITLWLRATAVANRYRGSE